MGACDRIGRKDPRRDAFVREALELTANRAASQIDPEITQAEQHRAFRRAIDVGCDDPLVLSRPPGGPPQRPCAEP